MDDFVIIGGGLAGCECALALARHGLPSLLCEMKPVCFSPAHASPDLGELVCSNSFRSDDAERSGAALLKREMRSLGSAVMAAAELSRVPAGKALAVDRALFSAELTRRVENDPLISLERREIRDLDDASLRGKTVVVAAGPLISPDLAASLERVMGESGHRDSRLYFYDAIAPIVSADSIDMSVAFPGSRYGNDGPPPPYAEDAPPLSRAERGTHEPQGEHGPHEPYETNKAGQEAAHTGDYLNCPLSGPEYARFVAALLAADKVPARAFEREIHFEGCMPIEALAARGERTLAFGPLKPVGFTDPRTGRRPYALMQLRAENAGRTAFNLVGCQTKMTYGAQARVFRLIPGLERAEFLRYGSMHRNTYVDAPRCLQADLSLAGRPSVFLAGQITGVEGYVESAASGLWLGLWLGARARGGFLPPPPPGTALGALLGHLQRPGAARGARFQPSNAHFGLMPPLEQETGKKARKAALAERAERDFQCWLGEMKRILPVDKG